MRLPEANEVINISCQTNEGDPDVTRNPNVLPILHKPVRSDSFEVKNCEPTTNHRKTIGVAEWRKTSNRPTAVSQHRFLHGGIGLRTEESLNEKRKLKEKRTSFRVLCLSNSCAF
jgi:hypothetical protein